MSVIQTRRGVAPVLGFILLFVLVVLASISVVIVGSAAIDDTQTEIDTATAEKLLRTVEGKATNLRRFEMRTSTAVEVPDHLAGQVTLDHDEAWVNVSIPSAPCHTGPIEMGTVRYDRDGETVSVYQAGGIFTETDAGTEVVSNPDLGYRQGSLQFHLLNFTTDRDTANKIVLSNAPKDSRDMTNSIRRQLRDCLEDASDGSEPPTINVEVHSQYASGWHQYFNAAYPNQTAVYFAENNTVKSVFDPENAGINTSTSQTPTLCEEGEDTEYRWDEEVDGNETELRLICGEDSGDEMRIRYDHFLDGGDNITRQIDSDTREVLDTYRNNTRWRYDQSSRNLTELHEYDLDSEGEKQVKDDDGDWEEQTDVNHSLYREWERDDESVDDYPSDAPRMGPPEVVAGALLRKHPYLTYENLTDGASNDGAEELIESLRETSPGEYESDPVKSADDYIEIRIVSLSSEQSQ
jgi:hypothetical protein